MNHLATTSLNFNRAPAPMKTPQFAALTRLKGDKLSKYKLHNERQQEYLQQISQKQQKTLQIPLPFSRHIEEETDDNQASEAELLAYLKQSKYKDRPNSSKLSSSAA